MATDRAIFESALRTHAADFGVQLSDGDIAALGKYYELLLKWNERLHLVAPCAPEEFATRHVLESLFLLRYMGTGTRLIDVGSGAGLPAVPCLIAQPSLHGTLIESSKRKAVFLKEAVHHLSLGGRVQVVAERFERTVVAGADLVTCRAIDRFAEVLPDLVAWAPPRSCLLFFVGEELCDEILKLLPGAQSELIPRSEKRFLVRAVKKD